MGSMMYGWSAGTRIRSFIGTLQPSPDDQTSMFVLHVSPRPYMSNLLTTPRVRCTRYGYDLLRTIAANSSRIYRLLRNHYPSNSGKRLSKNRRLTRARRPRTPTLSNAFERCSWTVCLEI